MKFSPVSLLLLYCSIGTINARIGNTALNKSDEDGSGVSMNSTTSGVSSCKVVINHDDSFECETQNGKLFPINASDAEIEMMYNNFVPGSTYIDISAVIFNEEMDELNFPKGLKLENLKYGKSVNKIVKSPVTTKSILMVRVIAKDSTTTASANTMIDTLDDIKGQLSRCSHGGLTMVRAPNKNGIGTNILNGVVEVSLPDMTISVGDTAMQNKIIDELNYQFNVDNTSTLADHVMLCLPPGTTNRSYAYISHWLSVMNDNSCIHPGTHIHELGHNFGLHHSNEGNEEYMDTTGLMGNYWYGDDEKMCFNGAKSWELDWFKNRHMTITSADTGYEGTLGSVIQDPSVDGPPIIIKISDYYITFNAATGITAGTGEAKNQVAITQQTGSHEKSFLVAKLAADEKYEVQVAEKMYMIQVTSITSETAEIKISEMNDAYTLPGSFITCPSFMDVSKEDCAAAGLSVGGRLRDGEVVEGSWNHVSVGCSLQGSGGDIHYNYMSDAQNTHGYIPVCEKDAYTLPGSFITCPSFMDVSKEDCAAAGLSVGGRLRDGEVVEGSWNHVSVGCSLQGSGGDIHYNYMSDAQNTHGYIPVCEKDD